MTWELAVALVYTSSVLEVLVAVVFVREHFAASVARIAVFTFLIVDYIKYYTQKYSFI